MGNCSSGSRKKGKGDSVPVDETNTENKPKEDVTYASIDHSAARASKRTRETKDDDDCDYATVNIPTTLQPQPKCSAKDDGEDDYVLMG